MNANIELLPVSQTYDIENPSQTLSLISVQGKEVESEEITWNLTPYTIIYAENHIFVIINIFIHI